MNFVMTGTKHMVVFGSYPPNHIATRPSVRMSAIEEEPGLMPEDTFRDIEELKKAIICAEILNRKY